MSWGPCQFFVSSLHGNAAISDGEFPVTISPSSQGAVLTPQGTTSSQRLDSTTDTGQETSSSIGKIHFSLPTLRSPEEETLSGKLTGHAVASVQLEILVSPHSQQATASACCKVVRVELYAGRDRLGLWESDGGLPKDQDIRIPVWADVVGAEENPFIDNPNGLCLTLTVDFGGGSSALLVSSVALIQSVESRKSN